MKMPIGDIIDRYTICKLKNERLSLSNENEINELLSHIKNYDGVEPFINGLYEMNGKIWDLESDIRKKNEHILGLEEVGRRAIKIREFNNLRVEIKNEVNSKFSEGYIEVKMNHGSESKIEAVISLTTVPERLLNENEEGLKLVLKSLLTQNDKTYEVHFNIPKKYAVNGSDYIIPAWVDEYQLRYPKLKIFRTEDFGPPTKFVPTIQRLTDEETIVIVVDDDLIYHPDLVTEHKKYQKELVDSVICYDGRGSERPKYNDLRDSWIICVTEITQTHFLQHYKSASYKKKLFDNSFFSKYLGKTLSDDVLISKYFRDKNIKMYSVPYEKENYLFETKELWDKNQGVVTFPILRCASSIENTGCNNPELLKIQPKFYEPKNWPDTEVKFQKFHTDKINHGYMKLYNEFFEKMTDSKNILHMGIKDDFLEMLCEVFPEATIYGTDSTYKIKENTKIKTFVLDQTNEQGVKKFIEEVNIKFDLIIDDGGHTMKQQQVPFGLLFKELKNGGIYIIEDLHTSLKKEYKNDDDIITTLDMLNNFNENKKIISNHISEENKNYINNNIENVLIWTRTPDFKESVTSVITKK